MIQIGCSQIDTTDTHFSVRYLTSKGACYSPFPVVVWRREDEQYVIVDGRQRLKFFMLDKQNTVNAIVLEPTLSPLDVFTIAIDLNAKSLEPMDYSYIIGVLRTRFECSIPVCLSLLEGKTATPLSLSVLQKYESIYYAQDVIKKAVSSGVIQIMQAVYLIEMIKDLQIQEKVLDVMIALRLNTNQQKEMIGALVSIARRQNVSVDMILQRLNIVSILSEEGVSLKDKSQRIRSHVLAERYPKKTAYMEALNKKITDLKLPKGVHLKFPPDMEGETFTVDIACVSTTDLYRKLEWLKVHGDAVGALWI